MKKFAFVVSLLLVLSFSVFAFGNTIKIESRGMYITGTLEMPKDIKNPPVVLMLHGFASSKDEVGNFYLNLAKVLKGIGIASLRIDFLGSGESEGLFEDTTVTGQVDDAKAAFEYLKNSGKFDNTKIGVVGFSLGGMVAAVLAGEEEGIKSLALWSSTGDVVGVFKEELGKYFPIAYDKGAVDIDLGWTKIRLKKAFFESLYNIFPYEAITHYKGALLTISGEKDTASVIGAKNFLYNQKGKLQKNVVISGVSHIYGVLSKNLKPSEEVINTTLEWFSKTLK